MWQPSNEANIHAGSEGWLSQAALESANGLWHHQQQPSYQLESIYQPETIYQYQTEQSWQLTDFESMQLPQSEQQFVESTEQPNDQRPAYPPSFQFHYPYQVASQRQNSQKPACQQQSFQQSNYLQQSYQQEANQQQSCQQTICPLACQQNCQSTRQSDFNALYNQRWKCDLYSLTEQPLAEVSISDADCPVCQWDRQFTRIREAPEPPDWPYTNWTTSQQRLPRIDGASKILMSFNSQLAAIYIDASVGHCAGGGGTGAGRHGGSGRGAGGGEGSGAGGGTSADGGAGGGASAGGGGGLSVSASSAMIAPRQLVNASRMKLAPSYARFESPNLTAPAAAQQPGSSASLHRRLAPTPPQQQQQQPPPPPPPAAHSKEAATPVPQSSEPESVAASRLIVPSAPKARRSSPRSSRVSDAVAKAAAKAAAAAPEPLQRDVAFERTSERSSMLKSLSSGGTPRPWTSGSGTVAVKAGAEGGAAPATSTATSEVTTTLGGAQIGEGESSEGNSGDDRPGKTTIQLLRFKTSDQAVPGNAPRRIEPPHFVSQHRPENVVSSGAAGDGFLRPQLGRPRSPQLQLHRANFSNSEVADQSNLAPSEAADRQKQIMANAMRLARLIEASWGLL